MHCRQQPSLRVDLSCRSSQGEGGCTINVGTWLRNLGPLSGFLWRILLFWGGYRPRVSKIRFRIMQIQHKEPLLAYRLSLQLPHVDGNDDRSTSACGRRMRRREVRALLQCCSPPARSAPPCSLAQETVKAVCIPLFCSTFWWPSFFNTVCILLCYCTFLCTTLYTL